MSRSNKGYVFFGRMALLCAFLPEGGCPMDLPFVMDTMFDLLNESDNLDLTSIEENEAAGTFLVTAHDGTIIQVQCSIIE